MRRGLADDRAHAHAQVAAGRVTVGGAPADKPSRLVAPADPIELVAGPPPFVGRGGHKLEAALDRFGVSVAGVRALDLGASTGGFTDCLLQRGAASVVAVDVGYGQLHERLRTDPRVELRERTNVRHLTQESLGARADVVVADLSFISLRSVLVHLLPLGVPGAHLVLLVKPQFEATRAEASRGGGVVSDPEVWRRVLTEVARALADRGAAIMGVMRSPLTGAEGNVEFLLYARSAPAEPLAPAASLIEGAMAETGAR